MGSVMGVAPWVSCGGCLAGGSGRAGGAVVGRGWTRAPRRAAVGSGDAGLLALLLDALAEVVLGDGPGVDDDLQVVLGDRLGLEQQRGDRAAVLRVLELTGRQRLGLGVVALDQ